MAAGVTRPEQAVERNSGLLFRVMRYILANPGLLAQLPDTFELVILPGDDLELLQYKLSLLETHDTAEKPVVFVRLPSSQSIDFQVQPPRDYVPLAA